MKRFTSLLEKILKNPKKGMVIKIKGKDRKLRAMVHLTTVNYMKDGDDYTKVLFEDGSFLLIIPRDKELYFAESILGHVKEIDDEDIGQKEELEFKGRRYRLDNKDDYQFVLKLIVGTPLEIEGECKFSDYTPIDGKRELLSLGWLVRTGARADIWCELININEIEII